MDERKYKAKYTTLEKVSQMVTATHLLIVGVIFVAFFFGRFVGRVESSILFSNHIASVIDAIRKVETLAALKGEDISKLSAEEIVLRANKQLQIKKDDE